MSRGFWVAAISMAFSVSLFANTTAQDFPKLKDYAKSLGTQPLNTMNQFHPETTFKNYNDKPDQERYYSGVETENIDLNVPAMNALKNDAGGQTVHDNFGKRQFEINKNNSAIQNAKLIEDESYAITHGISTARIKCDEKSCVKDLFCADGDCTDHVATANDNFGKSVSALAVAGEAGHEFSQTQSTLFAGRAQSCEVFGLDFLDCCASKGWGEKLNLAHCSGPEKELGKAKLNYLVYYIGEYCAKEWPWPINGCEIRKNTYCIFGSKLARIVQEQGRLKQLNNAAFGTPEHPNCSGMSIAELQQIQMDKIDFVTPIYPYSVNDRDIGGKPTPKAGIAGDMNLNQPNSGQTIDEIKRRVQQRAGQ